MSDLSITSFSKKLTLARNKFLRPPPKLNTVEWCSKNYYISDQNRPGFYDPEFAPYQKELLASFSDPNYNEFVWMLGSQTGKTLSLMQLLALTIATNPDHIMFAAHEQEFTKRFVKIRFSRMIEDVKALRPLIQKGSRGEHGDSWNLKSFPGGSIQFVTPGGSGGQLTGFPIRYVFADEVSKFPQPANGDPIALLRQRQTTYELTKIHKIIMSSTPLDEGTCRITKLYEDSDRRIYQHQCLDCHEFFAPKWEHVFFENDDPTTARLLCPHCGSLHSDIARLKGMRSGRWFKQNPSHKVAGFWINAISSPFVSLESLVSKYLKVKLDPALKKQFVNELLALPYKDEGVSIDELRLHERSEDYNSQSIPNTAIYITAGVDVQKDRLEAVPIAWASEYENYSLGRIVVNGSPDARATWDEMHLALHQPYIRKDGVKLKLLVTGVDTGFNQDAVFKFCNRFMKHGYLPVKGKGGATSYGAPIWGMRRKGRGIDRAYPVGTTKAKDLLLSWLNKGKFDPGKSSNPGYCHFSASCDEEYFNQLGSENKQRVRTSKGMVEKWVRQPNRSAEVLDCTVYAIAVTHYITELRVKNEISRITRELEAMPAPKLQEIVEKRHEPPAKPNLTVEQQLKNVTNDDRETLKARYAKMYGKRIKTRY